MLFNDAVAFAREADCQRARSTHRPTLTGTLGKPLGTPSPTHGAELPDSSEPAQGISKLNGCLRAQCPPGVSPSDQPIRTGRGMTNDKKGWGDPGSHSGKLRDASPAHCWKPTRASARTGFEPTACRCEPMVPQHKDMIM